MEDNGFFLFLIRYILCVSLLFYTYKSKRQNDLLKSVIYSFAALSIIMVADYLLSMAELFNDDRPFYEVNFIDFLTVTLFINVFMKQSGSEKIKN